MLCTSLPMEKSRWDSIHVSLD